jgi:hypothetical protein
MTKFTKYFYDSFLCSLSGTDHAIHFVDLFRYFSSSEQVELELPKNACSRLQAG